MLDYHFWVCVCTRLSCEGGNTILRRVDNTCVAQCNGTMNEVPLQSNSDLLKSTRNAGKVVKKENKDGDI